MRILFVPWDRFPPFRPAARAIFLEELPKRGHRIDWLIQADNSSPAGGTLEIDSGYAFVGPTDPGGGFFHRLRKNFLNFRNSFRILSLARQHGYDLIQAKDNFGAALLGLLVARRHRLPFFYWIAYPRAESNILEGEARLSRYPMLYRLRGHVLKQVLYRVILPLSDHVFVQSEQMKKDIAAEGVPLDRMTPVPSSVDLSAIPYDRKAASVRIGSKGDGRWVIYLGTMKRVRRLEFVIASFARVVEKDPQARLFMIGEGDTAADLEYLKSEARRIGISDAVVFTGFLDMSEGWEYIRHGDVCLSPYFPTPILQSTSPTKLVEYMAMGKAVVANDHPEQGAIIAESRCGICTPWDHEAFAGAILRILADPPEATRMGLRGRDFVERNRTNAVMGDRVEEIYRRVCGQRAYPSNTKKVSDAHS